MSLATLKTALDGTGLPFAHFAWEKDAKERKHDHGVWAEDDERSLYANNGHAERIWQGMIHWFTRLDTGDGKTAIEKALDAADIQYSFDSVAYEEDTGFLHYVWIFEVVK